MDDDSGRPRDLVPDPIDEVVFGQLVALERDGADGLVRKAISLYLKSLPDVRSDLQEAASRLDAARLSSSAHALKSRSGYVGALGVVRLCGEIEASAGAGALEAVARLLPALETEIERVATALEVRARQAG
jgi:HPt (histidine-containing phosphotransfer) domain-containing protein